MKLRSLALFTALAATLAACGGGGGGGDEDAFCDALEALSEQVADGDLGSDDGLDDATATVNELLEAADEGEQLDAVRAVGEEIADADPGDAEDTAEAVQDELGGFADTCGIDEDDFAVAPTTTAPSTTGTTTGGSETTGTTAGGGGGGDVEVFAREAVPADIAPEFASLAQACFDGDMASCDELFNTTPVDSVDEAYGDSCGGRIEDGQGFDLECVDVITGPQAVPGDVADQATAQACFDGNMVACDDLFRNSPSDSADELYGGLCGFRVQNTQAFCVDIFGEQAFL